MSNRYYSFKLFLICLFSVSCATTNLSSDAWNINVSSNKPTGECLSLGKVVGLKTSTGGPLNPAHLDARNEMLNRAANLGADYVYLIKSDENKDKSQFIGEAYSCKTEGYNESELKFACEQSDAQACYDYAVYLYKFRKEGTSNFLDKSCKLGHSKSCSTISKLQENKKDMEEAQRLEKNCESGPSKSCLELSFLAYKLNATDGAIIYAQKACVKDISEGCKFYAQLINNKTAKEIESSRQAFNKSIFLEDLRFRQEQEFLKSLNSMNQKSQQTNCSKKTNIDAEGNITYSTDCSTTTQ